MNKEQKIIDHMMKSFSLEAQRHLETLINEGSITEEQASNIYSVVIPNNNAFKFTNQRSISDSEKANSNHNEQDNTFFF